MEAVFYAGSGVGLTVVWHDELLRAPGGAGEREHGSFSFLHLGAARGTWVGREVGFRKGWEVVRLLVDLGR